MGASAYPGFKFAKDLPRCVDTHAEDLEREREDRIARQAVRDRDGRFCVCCGWRRASEVHEALVFRSRGGRPSLQNSIFVCAEPKGRCHQLLQKHRIEVEGTHCSKRIAIRMPKKIWQIVRPQPSDVRRKIVIER